MAYAIEVEIERNYAAFIDMIDELLAKSAGKYALFHGQRLEGIYSTAAEAGRAGVEKFSRLPFSIQLVSKEPVDLGFYSYATSNG